MIRPLKTAWMSPIPPDGSQKSSGFSSDEQMAALVSLTRTCS